MEPHIARRQPGQEVVTGAVPPYLGTAAWYAAWLAARLEGLDDDAAIAQANKSLRVSGKDFARCTVPVHGEPTRLSVAVAGGSHSLTRRGTEKSIRLSSHGNWPHVHLGTLEAVYGRTPYYQHIMPAIKAILQNPPATLAELNLALHRVVVSMIPIPGSPVSDACRNRARELKEACLAVGCPELTVLDLMMNHGPETALIIWNLEFGIWNS